MKYRAKIIADSIGPNGVRLTTMEFDIWKPLLAEFNTHGLLSRNFPSSRAMSWEKTKKKLLESPHIPIFRKNIRGMQAGEALEPDYQKEAEAYWLYLRDQSLQGVERLGGDLNIHKQWLNRLLEPWMTVTGLVTATDWDNFFNLRLELNEDGYPMAQDEFYFMTRAMKKAMDESEPKQLNPGEWHLPYVDEAGLDWMKYKYQGPFSLKMHGLPGEDFIAAMLSAGKCATVSYDNLGEGVDHQKDFERATQKLLPCGHMSVFQHQARCAKELTWMGGSTAAMRSGQLRGWEQFRKMLPGEDCWVSPNAGVELALDLPELYTE